MKTPDMTVTVIKSKGDFGPKLDMIEAMVIRRGISKHILYITVELVSDFEKKMAKMIDGKPIIKVSE